MGFLGRKNKDNKIKPTINNKVNSEKFLLNDEINKTDGVVTIGYIDNTKITMSNELVPNLTSKKENNYYSKKSRTIKKRNSKEAKKANSITNIVVILVLAFVN